MGGEEAAQHGEGRVREVSWFCSVSEWALRVGGDQALGGDLRAVGAYRSGDGAGTGERIGSEGALECARQ